MLVPLRVAVASVPFSAVWYMYADVMRFPGATRSGFGRPSAVGPRAEK